MLEQTTSTNIRIKKSYPVESKYLKGSTGLVQTRYSEPFGKYFLDKNKERITQVQTAAKSNKYSERYLVNLNKLQKINDKQKLRDPSRPQLNRTLSNSVNNYDEFNITSPMFKYNSSSTSQSHRSHIMTVNLKQLPKLQPSSNFNGSHPKIQAMKQDLNQFGLEVINLVTKTRDFKITFDKTKINLQTTCSQVEKNLNSKVTQLEKLVKNTQQEQKYRTQSLKSGCNGIKQKNMQLKAYLEQIQQKIEGIENILGVTTGHHKHFV